MVLILRNEEFSDALCVPEGAMKALREAGVFAGAVLRLTLNPVDVCSSRVRFSFCSTFFLQDDF